MADASLTELPQYACHKVVRAGMIGEIMALDGVNTGKYCLTFIGIEGVNAGARIVSKEWFARNKPQVGGYYVEYGSNYSSYSPRDVFEEGYTKIKS